jgi:hypothetical protein
VYVSLEIPFVEVKRYKGLRYLFFSILTPLVIQGFIVEKVDRAE